MLQHALATELLCVLRYRQHHYAATGVDSQPAAAEFLEHALEEQRHADRIADRITQVGAIPDVDPDTIRSRAHSEFRTETELAEMLREDLVAERVAVAVYTELIRWLGDGDPTTRRMFEDILANEEEHAEDLLALLSQHGSQHPADQPPATSPEDGATDDRHTPSHHDDSPARPPSGWYGRLGG